MSSRAPVSTSAAPAPRKAAAPPPTTFAASPAADAVLPANETDAIIEELKALAQSMLEATTAARSRAQAPDKKRSYEALMSAIEGRGLRPLPGSRASADGGSSNEGSGVFSALNGGKDPRRDPNLMLSSRQAKPLRSVGDNKDVVANTHINQDAGEPHAAAVSTMEAAADVPAALMPHHKPTASSERRGNANATLKDSHVASSSPNAEKSKIPTAPATVLPLGDNVEAAAAEACEKVAVGAATHTHHEERKSSASHEGRDASAETAAEDEDEDDNVFDGVRTQVLFKSTDVRAYCEMMASAWKPERLVRGPDGTSEVDDKDDEEGEAAIPVKSGDADGEIDDEDVVVSVQRRPPPSGEAQRTKVFRVPSFPFGGGITYDQYRALRTMFNKSICTAEAAAGASSSTTGPTAAAGVAPAPLLIASDAFARDAYDEVKPDILEREASFRPTSPYQFVVEVQRDVVFDAVRAREQRRKAFRRLAKEGHAPVTMGTFNLRVIMDPFKTGFEDEKNFPIVKGAIVADRYQIIQLLGKATFSRAVRCYDLHQPIYDDEEAEDGATSAADRRPVGYVEVCLKIINNTKDFFDQSLDEIRLLQLINKYKDPDDAHVVRLIDAFYYKEHTMLVTELLSDNLYEFAKYNREEEDEFYFTLPRLRRIARQVTEALAYVHSLNLIHTDLKPENILFLSHRRCIVKVIDFGSSCFLSDHLSSYIQSRSYRAPEVILGADYDGRIDVWSLGAILVELVTGDVLFTCETVPEMLARMVSVCGLPLPRKLLWEGRHTHSFINKFGAIYECAQSNPHSQSRHDSSSSEDEPYYLYTPVPPSPMAKPYAVLKEKLAVAGMTDPLFFSFVKDCLCLNHKARKTSEELLSHPFIVNEKV